jgi:hypothetical protein
MTVGHSISLLGGSVLTLEIVKTTGQDCIRIERADYRDEARGWIRNRGRLGRGSL